MRTCAEFVVLCCFRTSQQKGKTRRNRNSLRANTLRSALSLTNYIGTRSYERSKGHRYEPFAIGRLFFSLDGASASPNGLETMGSSKAVSHHNGMSSSTRPAQSASPRVCAVRLATHVLHRSGERSKQRDAASETARRNVIIVLICREGLC